MADFLRLQPDWRESCVALDPEGRDGCRSERRVEECWVMSMSVSATSNALSYLQQLMKMGTSGTVAADADPLSMLGQSIDGAGASGQPSSGAAAGFGAGSSPFD